MAITKRFASETYVTEQVTAVNEKVINLETTTNELSEQIDNIKYDIDELQVITDGYEDAITDIINTYASHTWVTEQIQAAIQASWEANY